MSLRAQELKLAAEKWRFSDKRENFVFNKEPFENIGRNFAYFIDQFFLVRERLLEE